MSHIHIAVFKWKSGTPEGVVNKALQDVAALAPKIPGITKIATGRNTSRYAEGYTHVVLVIGESGEAIDAYRKHPDHVELAALIDSMEQHGIGVDFCDGIM